MKNDKQQKAFSQPFTRRDFISTSLKAGTAAFTTGLLPKLRLGANCQNNVLFIIVDDLRPLLGCYGHSEMHTPNIDALAKRGTLFNRSYCQYPLCNPSRASMLTGLRPETVGVLDNDTYYRKSFPDAVTIPQYFKANSYHTRSVGKIEHGGFALLDKVSWSMPIWMERSIPIDKETIPSWQALDVADDELEDGRTANEAIRVLAEIRNLQFFLVVGFRKPHLPYNAPRKYYDLYDSETFKDVSSLVYPPSDVRVYADIPNGNAPISEEKTLELLQGYAASTSYIDAQVGIVLRQLDNLGLTEKTIIVFCGDHGFHLGEHGAWKKNTLFEVGVHSPLIISVPGQQPNQTDALTELVDIYPTLCDASQLPIPSQLEGLSLMPVINQPMRPWKTGAFSDLKKRGIHSRSIRTEQYRYTEAGSNGNQGRELYDYDTDPDETVNIANLPENKELVTQLSEQLHAGWQEALPDVSGRVIVPQTLPWDINDDNIVNIEDLLLVSNSFGAVTPENPKVDVNKDGTVDIIDLLLVASHLGETCYSSAPKSNFSISQGHIENISEWLTEAYIQDDGSDVFRDGIANLEALVTNSIPEQTKLLPNYPNPFNPETWIPYDLAQDANVQIEIYNLRGESVHRLDIGHQSAGNYRSKQQAAYWDGRNSEGELVGSGIYYYCLITNNSKSIRKMVIRK